MFYAQLNENNICIGISQLSGEIIHDNMIPIIEFSEYYIWRKYENGEWGEEKYEPESTAPITEFAEQGQRISDLEQAIAAIIGGAI